MAASWITVGRYGYRYLDHYWRQRGRFPYLIEVNGNWAGFALVNKPSPLPGPDWAMAEFFVLARYRRRHVGEQAARWLFDKHRGTWHVAELAENRDAQAFWRRVIRRYTAGRSKEITLRDDRWHGPVQVFRSPPATQDPSGVEAKAAGQAAAARAAHRAPANEPTKGGPRRSRRRDREPERSRRSA